jgi:hypothetical protein
MAFSRKSVRIDLGPARRVVLKAILSEHLGNKVKLLGALLKESEYCTATGRRLIFDAVVASRGKARRPFANDKKRRLFMLQESWNHSYLAWFIELSQAWKELRQPDIAAHQRRLREAVGGDLGGHPSARTALLFLAQLRRILNLEFIALEIRARAALERLYLLLD